MIMGNAGIVTLITTLVVSASQDRLILSFRNMSKMAVGLTLIILLFRSQKFLYWLGGKIRSGLRRTTVLAETDVTEILRQAEGYCVTRLHVAETSPLIDKTIASSGLSGVVGVESGSVDSHHAMGAPRCGAARLSEGAARGRATACVI